MELRTADELVSEVIDSHDWDDWSLANVQQLRPWVAANTEAIAEYFVIKLAEVNNGASS